MPPKPQNQSKPNPNQSKQNNNNNNTKPVQIQPQPKKEKAPKQPPQIKEVVERDQSQVPPVVLTVSTKSELRFIQLPIDPAQLPPEPQYLDNVKISHPTSDLIWTQSGQRCAVCTSEGIMVYDANTAPGASFELTLHAKFPYKSARFLQFSPNGNYLLSYETNTRTCPSNLIIWDLKGWEKGVFTPKQTEQDQSSEGELSTLPHPSACYAMAEKHDLPRFAHSTVQWTDDEEYCFILKVNGEILVFKSAQMTKPCAIFQQKGCTMFQISKIPRNNDKMSQFIAVFSPSIGDQPAKCLLYNLMEIVMGQSILSTIIPTPADIACGKYKPGTGPIHKYGPLRPVQSLVIFRTTDVQMTWHPQSQALLVRSSYDDDSAGYYAETRLYVMYTDREPVAVSFGGDAKGDIHDVQWCPTGFEFCTLHGPSRDAQCTLWYAKDCSAVRSIGSGPWNTIKYSPNGRLLLLAGFGSLSGKMEIWDKQKLVRLFRGQDDDFPRVLTWSPCGRYFVSGTLFPYLRVGNQFKITRYDGKVLYKELAKEPAIALEIKCEKEGPLIDSTVQTGPSEGHFTQISCNHYPRLNYFDDLKLSPEVISQAQKSMQEEAMKPAPLPPGVSKFSSAASRSKFTIRQNSTADSYEANSRITNQPQQTNHSFGHNGCNNQPRDLTKERQQGADVGFGAKPASQFQQQTQPKPQQKKQDDGFSWRR